MSDWQGQGGSCALTVGGDCCFLSQPFLPGTWGVSSPGLCWLRLVPSGAAPLLVFEKVGFPSIITGFVVGHRGNPPFQYLTLLLR